MIFCARKFTYTVILTVDFKRCLAFSRAHVVGSLYGELAGDAATSAVDGATVESIGILKGLRKSELVQVKIYNYSEMIQDC